MHGLTPAGPRSCLYGALSGPPYVPLPNRPPDPPPDPTHDEKAASMRIRLHGTPAETAAILAALAHVLTIRQVSRPYPDRPPSTWHRIYLDATPREQK
jgi:hypothetical protein